MTAAPESQRRLIHHAWHQETSQYLCDIPAHRGLGIWIKNISGPKSSYAAHGGGYGADSWA